NLSLEVVQNKTIILLCLETIWRPRPDLDRLQWRGIDFHFIDAATRSTGVTPLASAPKLGCVEDSGMCFACTLWGYCSKTTRE
ncbi:hypothetical protein BCV72DRAFT_313267, partial [Rhizopus microsporus var. microsporus]